MKRNLSVTIQDENVFLWENLLTQSEECHVLFLHIRMPIDHNNPDSDKKKESEKEEK